MEHVGLDLGKTNSQVCTVTEEGEILDRRIRTERSRLLEVFGARPKSRILLEASTESEWVARCLEQLGHDVIVGDPNYAPMYAQRSRRVKTDRRDAQALAEACMLGAYRVAHRVTDERRHLRAVLAVREALVRTRTRWVVLVHPLLRREGFRIPSGKAETFVNRVTNLPLSEDLRSEVAPLLALLSTLNKEIEEQDRRVEEIAQKDELIRRLTTAPGIGPITATAFVATIDRVDRFRGPHEVEGYLGLVPREWSSSEIQRQGHITKQGNSRMRWLLVEAAWCILRRRKKSETAALRAWADRIAARRGSRIAAVALARRLAGILYAMWRDGTTYDPSKLLKGVEATMAS